MFNLKSVPVMECASCRFFYRCDKLEHRGKCYRYPKTTEKVYTSWCGEYMHEDKEKINNE